MNFDIQLVNRIATSIVQLRERFDCITHIEIIEGPADQEFESFGLEIHCDLPIENDHFVVSPVFPNTWNGIPIDRIKIRIF